jgi:hypothetical protein
MLPLSAGWPSAAKLLHALRYFAMHCFGVPMARICPSASTRRPASPASPAARLLGCSEVRKTLIGRVMCERYAKYLGLEKYLVMGKSVRGE